jgi:UTP--glucose-1-phosphate uridylyltransferase
MTEVYRRTGASVIGVKEVPAEWTSSYGIVGVRENEQGDMAIETMVEKPAPQDAPSRLGVVGRYVLDPAVFGRLRKVQAGAGGEIQLTDGIATMLATHPVLALPLQGERFDCGSRHGFIKATIEYAMDDDEIREEMLDHMLGLLARTGRL